MPLYAFDCAGCGPFELRLPAGAASRCPACGGEARRVFTPPGLARMGRPLRRALDMEERSAHEPAVVTSKHGRPFHGGHARCC
jgi:putative FmdB family regulatory protein